jgi:hypothetical protein
MKDRTEYSFMALSLVIGFSLFLFYNHNNPQIPISITFSKKDPPTESTVRRSSTGQAAHGSEIPEWTRDLNETAIGYLTGRGVERDFRTAFAFFSLAAQSGDPAAMNNLGWMYENGLARDADSTKAIELYGKAAHLGSIPARNNYLRLTSAVAEISAAGRKLIRPSIAERDTVNRGSEGAMTAGKLRSSPEAEAPRAHTLLKSLTISNPSEAPVAPDRKLSRPPKKPVQNVQGSAVPSTSKTGSTTERRLKHHNGNERSRPVNAAPTGKDARQCRGKETCQPTSVTRSTVIIGGLSRMLNAPLR